MCDKESLFEAMLEDDDLYIPLRPIRQYTIKLVITKVVKDKLPSVEPEGLDDDGSRTASGISGRNNR